MSNNMEKFKVSPQLLDQNLKHFEQGYSLHDYGEVIKHLLNEVEDLKKQIKVLNSRNPGPFK